MITLNKNNEEMLATLQDRVANISNFIISTSSAGILPRKEDKVLLSWYNILIHAYSHVDIYDDDQLQAIKTIYEKLSYGK